MYNNNYNNNNQYFDNCTKRQCLIDSFTTILDTLDSERGKKSIANILLILPVQIVKVKTNIKAWTGSLQAMLIYLVQWVKVLTYITGIKYIVVPYTYRYNSDKNLTHLAWLDENRY